MTRVGVVTVTHGRTPHLVRQHEAVSRSSRTPHRYVVVAIDDDLDGWRPSVPGSLVVPQGSHVDGLPVGAARNAGVDVALRSGCDLVVLLDVDCLPDPGLVDGYLSASESHPDALLCGPVTYLPPPPPEGYDLDSLDSLDDPHPARPAPDPGEIALDPAGHDLFWSLSFAVTPRTWARIEGFDEAYVGYGAEDTDLGRRARRAGIPLAWVGAARAFHQHHPVSDPPVEHVVDIVRNARLFHDRWGDWPMGGWLDDFERRGLVRRCAGDLELRYPRD